MSRLYIRVMTGFYSHRKTVRLFSKLGSDAFWIPPRVWAYAAENQPDGNLSGYQPEELAMLVGYNGDATSMLKALKDCGFMDDNGMIHDWMEHNGYHEKYSVRAKTAAAARWAKVPPQTPLPKTGKEKVESGDKHCLEHATSINHYESMRVKISQFYERTSAWTNFEEQMLLEIVQNRPDNDLEFEELVQYHASLPTKDLKFFPKSIESLLTNWTKTLDISKTQKRLNGSVSKVSGLSPKEQAALDAKIKRESELLVSLKTP